MNKIINSSKLSSELVVTAGLTLAIAMTMLVAIPQAHASEYPNILVGQDLTVGSSNQNVVVLQGLLSELGFLSVPVGTTMGYYGTLTKQAVSRYQASLYVTPAAGYYGGLTKAAMHSDFASKGYLSLLGW
ncbi:MAG: peptidoglycan-binding domain-containing protein [Patescibacteria group bacterium]